MQPSRLRSPAVTAATHEQLNMNDRSSAVMGSTAVLTGVSAKVIDDALNSSFMAEGFHSPRREKVRAKRINPSVGIRDNEPNQVMRGDMETSRQTDNPTTAARAAYRKEAMAYNSERTTVNT